MPGDTLPRLDRPTKFLRRASTRTHFARVPRRDWAVITQGLKTEVRVDGAGAKLVSILDPPSPLIVYSPATGYGGADFRYELMHCDAAWREPLGAISEESLAREGFESLADFRRYWRQRHSDRRFNPMQRVSVLQLRPWRGEQDERFHADRLLDQLYLEIVRDGVAP